MTVFANGLEISSKKQGCKVIAAFPDTCFTPPLTPATPPGVPVPYPDFGQDSDLTSGTGTVNIGGEPVSQENSSKYSKCSGDEAGSAPKKGIVTSKNMGAVYAQKWSMDVKFEGKGVVRFGDMATSNHACNPGDSPPMVIVGQPNPAAGGGGNQAPAPPACPCCGAQPPHPHQIDQNGALLPQIPEADYYRNGHAAAVRPHQDAIADFNGRIAAANNNLARATANGPNPGAEANLGAVIARHQAAVAAEQAQVAALDAQLAQLEGARNNNPLCPNLHDPPDQDCGVHFDRTGQPPVDRDALGFDAAFRNGYRQAYDAANGTDLVNQAANNPGDQNRINHRTPLDAGGCPTSNGNLIPHPVLSADCQAIDDIQGRFQGV